MIETDSIKEKVKDWLPILELIAIAIGCVLGIVIIVMLLRLAACGL